MSYFRKKKIIGEKVEDAVERMRRKHKSCNKGAYGHVFANFCINTSAETFKTPTNGRHSLLCALVMLKAAFAVILVAVLFIFYFVVDHM